MKGIAILCKWTHAFVAGVALLAVPAAAEQPGYVHVELSGETLTVVAHDVTLRDLLEEITRQGGRMPVPRESRVSLQCDRTSLIEALTAMLGSETPAGPASETKDADDAGRLASLLRALADVDAAVRREAASGLSDLGGEEAAAALTTAALFDEDPAVREEAVHGLGQLGGESQVETLRQALTDPVAEVRETAVEAVIDIGGNASARALAFALTSEHAALREEAVYGLGDIGGEIAIHLLQQALADGDDTIREAAAEILAELGDIENRP